MPIVGSNVEGGIITNSGHWIMEEQPDQTVKLVRAFLDKKSEELHAARIIRAFAGYDHVMHVAFAKARARDAHEFSFVVEVV
jgi:hypothetical protein